jgi:hypothetical protein
MTEGPLWEPLDQDNVQPEHTCDWDYLTKHTFVPCSQLFCLLKPIAHVCAAKMAEDGLSAYSLFRSLVINLLSLPPSCLFIWCLGVGGQTWHKESQEFGPWVQNSNFKTKIQ